MKNIFIQTRLAIYVCVCIYIYIYASLHIYISHCCSVTQLFLILYNSIDCSPAGFSVHRISQTRTPKRVAISFSGDLPDSELNPCLLCLLLDSLPLYHLESPRTHTHTHTHTSVFMKYRDKKLT